MYASYKGEIPEGLQILHKCDVRACCNPAHLFIGTQSDNIDDMHEKGRWERKSIGAKSKLSAKDINNIRQRYDTGEHPEAIAKDYDISRQTAWRIGIRRSFQFVEDIN